MTQVKSKRRVADHGEVFTNEREVNSMLDLVKHETERIDSKFLEPACGTGNFLIEVLKRKLDVVCNKYKKNQLDFERNTILATSSIYGIDLLEDNIIDARLRLFNYIQNIYTSLFKHNLNIDFLKSIEFILLKNLIQGNALTMMQEPSTKGPIIFPEWEFVTKDRIKRRDFRFDHLMASTPIEGPNLFSDLGEEAFIPTPTKDYQTKHYKEIFNYD
ncbi:SAM-dependent DNA methyltransferase [Myroides odoratimimus]|uniref:SAM-dependent DNA methyltransferase n=1 Tax=Myroides odoratimimus TaxID=76832 RepID=UPI002578BB06|nr:SAM-dependent DNA methyltransferase [Myroides odoratimimus]MDM1514113.1 SAM-dependent DNA methyltransferase [Myroides odoratimimus]